MEMKTYRAKSMQEALRIVRQELGPDAAVLHTREIRPGLLGWLGTREIEVVASREISVPSRFDTEASVTEEEHLAEESVEEQTDRHDAHIVPDEPPGDLGLPPAHLIDYRSKFRDDLRGQLDDLHSMLEDLCHHDDRLATRATAPIETQVLNDLLRCEFSEELSRELLDRLRHSLVQQDWFDPVLVQSRLQRLIESEIPIAGPIRTLPYERKIVALVGPTGVGKTTTIAKLAANFHLKEKRRVGLITVDTYRIAAVDQLRTYAEIISLPMEVVSTPREMRGAIARLSECDLILMDTAGRSPRDEVKVQELKTLLNEAQAHEVHLVLSCVSSESSSQQAAKRFTDIGATSLILTKLDEATGLGGLVPLFRSCRLPLSYLTFGQNVPDDVEIVDRRRLVERMLRKDDTN